MTKIKIMFRGNLLLTGFLLLAFSALGQKIPKGSKYIKVTGVSLMEVTDKLMDQDYSIDKVDTILQTVRTLPQHDFVIEVRLKDSTAIIKGLKKDSPLSPSYYTVSYDGLGTITFMLLNIFAASFNKPIEYQ